MALERYRARLTAFGRSLREQEINKQKYQVDTLAPHSVAYKDVTVDEVARKLLITSTETITRKNIYTMPDEDFDVGAIVHWNGSHWLITQRDLDNDIVTRGVMEQCNRQLIWQNPQTREIISIWATVEKPYYSNLAAHSRIEVSTREFKIQIPYTAESCLIDVGKRFMLEIIGGEPKTYRVVSVDSMTQRFDRDAEIKGFIILNLEQDLYNPLTDNIEKEVCDYLEENEKPVENFEQATITYKGKPAIRAGGSAKQFVGNITTKEIGHWVVKTDTDGIQYTIDGNTVKLKADYDMKIIGSIVQLEFSNQANTAKAMIEVEVVS